MLSSVCTQLVLNVFIVKQQGRASLHSIQGRSLDMSQVAGWVCDLCRGPNAGVTRYACTLERPTSHPVFQCVRSCYPAQRNRNTKDPGSGLVGLIGQERLACAELCRSTLLGSPSGVSIAHHRKTAGVAPQPRASSAASVRCVIQYASRGSCASSYSRRTALTSHVLPERSGPAVPYRS